MQANFYIGAHTRQDVRYSRTIDVCSHAVQRSRSNRRRRTPKKLAAPQIQDDPTVFTHCHCEPRKQITICCCIEVAKTLRDADRKVEGIAFWAIVANIRVHIAWAAS